jgi:uncharacterized membrane protein YeaQ/YmgE (transglycosylase-associated protein family)
VKNKQAGDTYEIDFELKIIGLDVQQINSTFNWERRGIYPGSATGDKHMSVLGWLILGLIAGFIGSKIVNREGQGFFLNVALGIVGAIVGGALFSAFGAQGITGLNIYSMIVAVLGSIVVLVAYHALAGSRSV